AHQVLCVEYADDVLGATLGIKNRNSRMLLLHHSVDCVLQRQVPWQRKNIGSRNHHLSHGDVLKFQGMMNHLFLHGGDLLQLPTCRDDELDFIRRMYWPLPHAAEAKHSEDGSGRCSHDKDYRPCNCE